MKRIISLTLILSLVFMPTVSYCKTIPLDKVNQTQIEWLAKKYGKVRIYTGIGLLGDGLAIYSYYHSQLSGTPFDSLSIYEFMACGAPGAALILSELLSENKSIGGLRYGKDGKMYVSTPGGIGVLEVLSGFASCSIAIGLISLRFSSEESPWDTTSTAVCIAGGALSFFAGIMCIVDGIFNSSMPASSKETEEHYKKSESTKLGLEIAPGYFGLKLAKRY